MLVLDNTLLWEHHPLQLRRSLKQAVLFCRTTKEEFKSMLAGKNESKHAQYSLDRTAALVLKISLDTLGKYKILLLKILSIWSKFVYSAVKV